VTENPFGELERNLSRTLRLTTIPVFLAAAIGCAGVKTTGQTGSGGSSGNGGGGGGTQVMPTSCNGKCTDFPTDPIVDSSAPGNPASMFGGGSGAAPCVVEPEDGALFPNNWLRPRIHVTDGAGVYKITLHADKEANDLVAYTGSDSWSLPKDIWQNLASHVVLEDISVTVQKAGGGTTTVAFQVAPVGAAGNLVFWAANPALVGAQPADCYKDLTLCANASQLRGFSVGDESTVLVLAINQVQQPSRAQDSGNPAPVVCIGCHAATPDPSFVTLIDHYSWRAATASVAGGPNPGAAFPTVTPGGLQALQQPGWGPFTYTKADAYWQPGKRIGVASLGEKNPLVADWSNSADSNDSPHLAWINLEAPNAHMHADSDPANWAFVSYAGTTASDSGNALGFIAHNGDAGGAATPNWSHDGNTIAYASTNASISGRLNIEAANVNDTSTDPLTRGTKQNPNAARAPGLTNIFTVPFNNGLGGNASPVAGAATTQFEEYYPAYSPDDKFLAFTRVPAGQVMFANPNAEIAVVPAGGGQATPLSANKPPACTGKTSPGVNNHWPKWSPEVRTGSNGTYYWLIFSSNRAGLAPVTGKDNVAHQISQLYLAPVVQTETGLNSYPAIYLWNQPTDSVNTTPAWATFQLPPVQ
jgi:WD40-like Beta Propeller Repeat